MHNMNIEYLYLAHRKTIQKMAWKFSRKTGIEFDEMEAEGNLIFMEAVQTWKAEKSSFNTWLTIQLNRLNKSYKIEESYGLFFDMYGKEDVYFHFSRDAEFIQQNLDKILYDPEKQKKRITQKAISLYLREIGWNWNRIQTAFREIKEAL